MPIFSGIVAAFTAVTAWFGALGVATQAFVKIGLGLAISRIAIALVGTPDRPEPRFAVNGTLRRGADIPQSFIIGRYATAGSLVWGEEWGEDDNTPNAYLTLVIELSNLPVRGLHGLYIDGQPVTIENANPHSSYGKRITEVIGGSSSEGRRNYDGYAWIKFYDGTQTTADSWLRSAFGTGDWRLNSNFIGRGNAYAIVTVRVKNEGLWSGFPEFLFVVDGIELAIAGKWNDQP